MIFTGGEDHLKYILLNNKTVDTMKFDLLDKNKTLY